MFGTNTITGKAFFDKAGDRLLVTSIFLTLQGEGPYQGQPALFIRMTKCQLQCNFCDTFFDEGTWFTIDELAEKVENTILDRYDSLRRCGLVITGGEPSLQTNIHELLARAISAGAAFTQVESNGILYSELPLRTTLVVSPKCNEKTGKYFTPHAKALSNADCLKFVVSADKESPYHTIPDWAFEWKHESRLPIYISPMNIYKPAFLEMARNRIQERIEHNLEYRSTIDEVVSGWDDAVLDREQNRKNHEYAWRYCEKNGLYLTLQMQLYGSAA